jgi:large subunit ribosomal protein L5
MNTPRLQERYTKEIVPAMMERFKLTNALAVPHLDKIVVNMGVGEALADVKILDKAMDEMAAITGQKPLMRRAKIAISNFKIKENNPIGCKVTLRRRKMYEFLDRLISIALPRIRDFRGVPTSSFDNDGNYALGLAEQTIFPEIEYDRITRVQGMDIIIVIRNSKGAEMSRELLKLFGMPFKEKD